MGRFSWVRPVSSMSSQGPCRRSEAEGHSWGRRVDDRNRGGSDARKGPLPGPVGGPRKLEDARGPLESSEGTQVWRHLDFLSLVTPSPGRW